MKRTILIILFALFPALLMSQTYSVAVGETQYLWVPDVSPGYVEHAVWGCTSPNISFESQDEICAIIRVVAPFSGTATVELVYVQTYWGYYTGTVQHVTHYKEYYIVCNGGGGSGSNTPTYISIQPTLNMTVGSIYQLVPQLTPVNSTTTLWWGVNPPGNGISVDGNGSVYAYGLGTATVTVTTDNDLSASCFVRVVDPYEPVSVSLPEIQTVRVGETITLTPDVSPSNSNTTLTWFTDDASVAIVSQGVVSGLRIGTANITVKTTNNIEAHCVIKVINAVDIESLQEAYSAGINAIYRIRQYK